MLVSVTEDRASWRGRVSAVAWPYRRTDSRDFHAELAEGLADEIPVVVVTGDARGLRDVGFSCVLHKPIDPHKLERPCRSACRARESPPPRNRPCDAAV